MKFSCAKKELLEVLMQVSKAIAIKPMTPVLTGIYLKVSGDILEVQANNYSLGMSGQITVNAQDDGGDIVVIGKKFIEVVKAMPDDVILIAKNDKENYLEVSSGRSNYSIATMNAEDFPKVLQRDAESNFKIQASVLRNLIKRTVFACSNDEGHPLYTGCLFETEGDKITVASTNMHRLSVAKDKLLDATDSLRFVVPAYALRSIYEMLPDDEEKFIKIDYTGKNVAFNIGEVFLTARIIEGNFPDYNRVIPASSTTFVEILVEELRQAIDRISIISRDSADKKVSFDFSKNGLEICAASSEIGSGTEHVHIALEGPEINMSFNCGYLADVLKILKNGNCKMALNGAFDPVDIREGDSDDYIYVVTPVRP